MRHNIGKVDQIIRIILAALLLTLRFLDIFKGDWPDISVVLAALLVITAVRRCSPIYSFLGFGTCGISNQPDDKKPIIKTKPYRE